MFGSERWSNPDCRGKDFQLLGRYAALFKCVLNVDREAFFLTSGRPRNDLLK